MSSMNASFEGADKPSSASEQERKRLRNRLSQQAFRRRQAERIRDLSNRVNEDQKSDGERMEALQRENRQLREQLVEVQAKMSRLLATLQGLNDSVSKTLGDTANNGDRERKNTGDKDHASFEPFRHNHKQNEQLFVPPAPSLELEHFDASILEFDHPFTQQPEVFGGDDFASSELINVAGISPIYPQIPNIWSFEYQMGIQPYLTAMAANEESTPSTAVEEQAERIRVRSGWPIVNEWPVLMVLSMFNSMTRPDVMAWYAKTRFFHIIELTAWQLYPSSATFEKLHQRYRPTETQLKHPHPRVIDWIPFPSIRDRLIQLHSGNPQIDQIFCDAVTGYVVETLMSDLIIGAPQITVYVRVTDLITAMAAAPASGEEASIATLPAPNIATLFTSAAYARAAFKHLNMDKGASYYKIDPAFYAKYPELYDQSSDLTAAGMPLKPKSQKVLTYPKPLDSSTVETYRSFIDFSLDAANTISSSTTPTMPSQFPAPAAAPRYSFLDDYSEGAHPALLKAILSGNTSQEAGYGGDTYCDLARQRIRRHLGREDVGIFFVPSGTSANAISIAACLRPHEAVIAASSGHIVTRETGAVEASGHKIINAAPLNGKLTPQTIQRAVDDNWHFPHMAKPRLVYISNATEIGTIYTRAELAAIKQVCEKNHLILFLDGARIGTALASKANDMTLTDVLELTDIFWIGGTKNGALLGEAVVVKDARLASEFEFYVKQHGSLLAKSRIMGAQFAELFREDLYFDLARQANLCAETLSRGVAEAGFSVYAVTETNQVFAVLPLGLIQVLQEHFTFYVWEKRGDDEAVVRLLTTWATETTEVEKFIGLVYNWNK
ncbi:hypothetical protein EsH8_VIII_000115 [Colletotrichum jinshuiense]